MLTKSVILEWLYGFFPIHGRCKDIMEVELPWEHIFQQMYYVSSIGRVGKSIENI